MSTPDEIRDRRVRRYQQVWNDDIDAGWLARLKGPPLAIYLALGRFASSADRTAFPSLTTLMRLTGYSRQGVVNGLNVLKEHRLVRMVKQGGPNNGSNIYELYDPPAEPREVVNDVD